MGGREGKRVKRKKERTKGGRQGGKERKKFLQLLALEEVKKPVHFTILAKAVGLWVQEK